MKAELLETPLLPLDITAQALAHVSHAGAGGIDVFVGVVRDYNDGHVVSRLEYQAYAPMAVREMQRIGEEIEREMPGTRLCALHRVGMLAIGDAAVVCAASAPHRAEAFEACRRLIDRIKARVPIWKREHGPDGVAWVGWVDARCGGEHAHAPHAPHAHAHAPHAHAPHEHAPHEHAHDHAHDHEHDHEHEHDHAHEHRRSRE